MEFILILLWYLIGVITIGVLDSIYYDGKLLEWIESAPKPIIEYSVPFFWPLLFICYVIQKRG